VTKEGSGVEGHSVNPAPEGFSHARPPTGQDDAMPRIVHETVPLPRLIDEAYEVVRAPIRILIAHYLAGHPAARIGEIIDAIGGERMTVRNHLEALEHVGIINASLPPGERKALPVRYSLDHGRWTGMLIRIINYLPAEPQDQHF
jgi:DNA-binding transcriptional ArsR family regulator